jgi:hypothetical protein
VPFPSAPRKVPKGLCARRRRPAFHHGTIDLPRPHISLARIREPKSNHLSPQPSASAQFSLTPDRPKIMIRNHLGTNLTQAPIKKTNRGTPGKNLPPGAKNARLQRTTQSAQNAPRGSQHNIAKTQATQANPGKTIAAQFTLNHLLRELQSFSANSRAQAKKYPLKFLS